MNINYALVSAFERTKVGPSRVSSMRLFTALLLGLFFMVLLVCLAVGVRVYGVVAQAQAASNAQHVQTGLVANLVHMNDNANALQRGEGPEGAALVLVEALDSGTYETRIYAHDGWVVQEYAIAGRPYNPDSSVPLFESRTFDFRMEGSLLTITTDAGDLDVALRSTQEGGGALPAAAIAGEVGAPVSTASAVAASAFPDAVRFGANSSGKAFVRGGGV